MESNYKLEGTFTPTRASSLSQGGASKDSVPRRAPPGSLTPIPEVANTNWGSSISETEIEERNQGGPSSKQSAHWESLLDPVSEPPPNQRRGSPVETESPIGTVHAFGSPTTTTNNDNPSVQHQPPASQPIQAHAGQIGTGSNNNASVQSQYDPNNALGIFKAVNWNPSPLPHQQKTFEPSKSPQYVQNYGEKDRMSVLVEMTQEQAVKEKREEKEEDIPPATATGPAPRLGRWKRVKRWVKRQRDKLRDCLPSRSRTDSENSQGGP